MMVNKRANDYVMPCNKHNKTKKDDKKTDEKKFMSKTVDFDRLNRLAIPKTARMLNATAQVESEWTRNHAKVSSDTPSKIIRPLSTRNVDRPYSTHTNKAYNKEHGIQSEAFVNHSKQYDENNDNYQSIKRQ